jgi:hypothetical protein
MESANSGQDLFPWVMHGLNGIMRRRRRSKGNIRLRKGKRDSKGGNSTGRNRDYINRNGEKEVGIWLCRNVASNGIAGGDRFWCLCRRCQCRHPANKSRSTTKCSFGDIRGRSKIAGETRREYEQAKNSFLGSLV